MQPSSSTTPPYEDPNGSKLVRSPPSYGAPESIILEEEIDANYEPSEVEISE
jgi:hypothetical protein